MKGKAKEIENFTKLRKGKAKKNEFLKSWLGPLKAGQVGAYKATHGLILGARMTPIRPLLRNFFSM